ncbi:membrane-bound lytic murein transglycosylase B [bacterium MnTg02]|nr:membrane-bound lytic murein transglycosylase B [bacterium MnTg02]
MQILRVPMMALALGFMLPAAPSLAASCGNSGSGFGGWLASFKKQAAAQGISQRTLVSALKGVTYNKTVIRLDRSQKAFKQSFRQFASRRVTKGRLAKGKRLMQTHARTLARIERRFGVPAPVIVAIWGLETDYGANTGRMPVMRSLATLAYDCRRSKFFQNELMNALRIVERGDRSPGKMRGAWAGELGQTQFLASSYMKFAVDFDGNGRPDLIRSIPDVLASTANYLKGYGWRAGGGWNEGATNFPVLQKWNKSQIYSKTIALMATKLAGKRR